MELQNVTFSGGACTGTLAFNKNGSGGFTNFASTLISCHTGMVIRFVHTSYSQFMVYVDNVGIYYLVDTELTGGQPGVGAARQYLGQHDGARPIGRA